MNRESHSDELAEHFFRNEYGKIVSVITKYLGTANIESAEDIVQDTMLKAAESWKHSGIPANPQAWLYTTAKNITFNLLKHKKVVLKHEDPLKNEVQSEFMDENTFTFDRITDEQLKMMFACCHSSIPENAQIALILKILCGFSITEIAQAFYTNNETINKRLVRGRKQLKEVKINFDLSEITNDNYQIVLKAIYLLFNEGYSPNQQGAILRYDLCLEAIRIAEILYQHKSNPNNSECAALLALMYLNVSRFMARNTADIIETTLDKQDRSLWNQELITTGIHYLNYASQETQISKYLILAAISANHCVAKSYKDTNWTEILSLYDNLIQIENSPLTRINRSVAMAIAQSPSAAIDDLLALSIEIEVEKLEIFHATIGEFYKLDGNSIKALKHIQKAVSLSRNDRNKAILQNKIKELVPI